MFTSNNTLDTLAAIETLDDLLDLLQSEDCPDDLDMSGLPKFGGREPSDTTEVWSWDRTRLLVGTCAGDMEIVPR